MDLETMLQKIRTWTRITVCVALSDEKTGATNRLMILVQDLHSFLGLAHHLAFTPVHKPNDESQTLGKNAQPWLQRIELAINKRRNRVMASSSFEQPGWVQVHDHAFG